MVPIVGIGSMPLSASTSVIADIMAHANELPGKLIAFMKMNQPLLEDADNQ